MSDLREHERRKPGARGTALPLANGQEWLLAAPTYRPGADSLTTPRVDGPLDRIFEGLVLEESLSLPDIWEAARVLLKANYHLDDREALNLLRVEPGENSERLASAVLELLFGSDQEVKSYSDWARASLLANGLTAVEVPARDLPNVLAILVATHRTVPLSRFADVCKKSHERKPGNLDLMNEPLTPEGTVRAGIASAPIRLSDGRSWGFARPSLWLIPEVVAEIDAFGRKTETIRARAEYGYPLDIQAHLDRLREACQAGPVSRQYDAFFALSEALLRRVHDIDRPRAAALLTVEPAALPGLIHEVLAIALGPPTETKALLRGDDPDG